MLHPGPASAMPCLLPGSIAERLVLFSISYFLEIVPCHSGPTVVWSQLLSLYFKGLGFAVKSIINYYEKSYFL